MNGGTVNPREHISLMLMLPSMAIIIICLGKQISLPCKCVTAIHQPYTHWSTYIKVYIGVAFSCHDTEIIVTLKYGVKKHKLDCSVQVSLHPVYAQWVCHFLKLAVNLVTQLCVILLFSLLIQMLHGEVFLCITVTHSSKDSYMQPQITIPVSFIIVKETIWPINLLVCMNTQSSCM